MAISVDDLVFDTPPDDITEAGEPAKPRRGRPPGTRNGEGKGRRTTSESRTVSEAMGTMQSAYDLIALLLKPLAPNAARIFSDGVPKAQESNRRAFEASPKLAKRVASTGEKGGSAAFFIGNAALIAPVVAVAAGEVSAKLPKDRVPRAPRPPQQRQQPQQPRQDIPRPKAQPLIPTGEGFEIPNVPIWNPNQPNVV
jgi:hypothetical protein